MTDPRIHVRGIMATGTPDGTKALHGDGTWKPSTGGLDAEGVRDTIAAALVAGSGMTITVDDAGNTITLASTGGGGGTSSDSGWLQVGADSGATSFQNSWVNFGGGEQPAAYRRIAGVVYLSGIIKSGTVGAAAFTLPTGYRPDYQGTGTNPHIVYTISNGAVGRVNLYSDGKVEIWTPSSNAWVALRGIVFPAA